MHTDSVVEMLAHERLSELRVEAAKSLRMRSAVDNAVKFIEALHDKLDTSTEIHTIPQVVEALELLATNLRGTLTNGY